MFKYSDKTLAKYPWKWKYDKRFKRSCSSRGHRFHWNRAIRTSSFILSVGACFYCAKICQVAVQSSGNKLKVIRMFESPDVITISKENMQELIAYVQAHQNDDAHKQVNNDEDEKMRESVLR